MSLKFSDCYKMLRTTPADHLIVVSVMCSGYLAYRATLGKTSILFYPDAMHQVKLN
jgi:hypothetical protein